MRETGSGDAVSFYRRARGHRSFMLGGTLVALLIALALLSFIWTPYPAAELDIPHICCRRRPRTGSAPTAWGATSSRC